MSYLRCDYQSAALGMCTSFIALLPDDISLQEVPVMYLLHGLSDNCTGWTRYTAVERYARDHKVAVIMPEVQRSFYTDMEMGPDYFTFVTEELPEFCHRVFGLSREREKNCVCGLSMGGYGALKCALRRPENYRFCASFSAVTDIADRIRRAEPAQLPEFCAMIGQELKVPADCDLFLLLEAAGTAALPEFYLTCGEQDGLYEENCRMAEALERKGCRICFDHWEGVHSWMLWDRSIRQTMDRFF